jgi:DNA-binding NtrC family response regulator
VSSLCKIGTNGPLERVTDLATARAPGTISPLTDRSNETRPMSSSGPRVVVVWEGGMLTRPLPARGALAIGRGAGCEILVDHPSVSRRHAMLHVGPRLAIEDLSSANGTRVGGRPLTPGAVVALDPVQVVEIGDALLSIQGVRPDDGSVRTLESMAEVHRLLALVAPGTISVLLLGETGVGKEVMAERVHRGSTRAAGPFVRLNCAAFSEQLVESELFGHERGAFTGAMSSKPGLLEAADGGTMFFDEVAELTPALQAKLLRVLEAGEVTRVGALRPRRIDVRYVCATNRDLVAACAARVFRDDLYHRLNGITIRIPPLRQRRDEIMPLARAFAEEAFAALGKPPVPISDAARVRLEEHPWPGNVRELKKSIERAVLLCHGKQIEIADLRLDEPGPSSEAAVAPVTPVTLAPPSSRAEPTGAPDLRSDLASLERARIVAALAEHAGNQTRAAAALGISRRTLVSRMEAYGLPRPRKPA